MAIISKPITVERQNELAAYVPHILLPGRSFIVQTWEAKIRPGDYPRILIEVIALPPPEEWPLTQAPKP
jgi:hypothetical protein